MTLHPVNMTEGEGVFKYPTQALFSNMGHKGVEGQWYKKTVTWFLDVPQLFYVCNTNFASSTLKNI